MKSYFKISKVLVAATLIGMIALPIIISAANARTPNQAVESYKNNQQSVLLQGFADDTEVYYSIFSSVGLITEGHTQTNAEGSLVLNFQTPQDPNQIYHLYDFRIANDGNYVSVQMRHELRNGKITINGNGLNEFTEVSLVTPEQESLTKTDWTGAFAEDTKLNSDQKSEFQLALHGFSNLGAMAQKENPAIIKVLAAPNGGGPLNNDSTITLSPPSSGLYPLSTGDLGHINSTIATITRNYIQAMMLMTEQLSAVVMHQTLAIGQFFDAKIQLETQRTHQQLKAEAVKDYHPSEQMCQFGTYMRSVANTELKANADKFALNDFMMERYKGKQNNSAARAQEDIDARLKQFREVYCNPKDNNGGADGDSALGYMCEHAQDGTISGKNNFEAGANGIGGVFTDKTLDSGTTFLTPRFNKDVDFTRTMDFPNTLDMHMNDGTESPDEEDVMALAKNLYWPTPILFDVEDKQLPKLTTGYMDAQRVIALSSMAHNSYTNLASLKARAHEVPSGSGLEPGWTFMKTLMREFGITDDEIELMIGEQPSYWAQMEVLTKKIYQTPNFYTNLYDKPVNVDRIGVTLDAIKLMQLRDYYTSTQRREMLNSAMLETELVNGNHYSRGESGTLFSR